MKQTFFEFNQVVKGYDFCNAKGESIPRFLLYWGNKSPYKLMQNEVKGVFLKKRPDIRKF